MKRSHGVRSGVRFMLPGWAAFFIFITPGAAPGAVNDLRITEVDALAGQVEVTNISIAGFTASTALPFYHKGNTSSEIPSGTTFAAGESKTFSVTGLGAADSDLWLFKDTNFDDSQSIIAGLKWGSAPDQGKVALAVSAGIWPSTTSYVNSQTSAAQSLRLMAYDPRTPANWLEGTPSPGLWFGTGTPILDPLPAVPKSNLRVDLQPVATGLAAPVAVVDPDDQSNRLFICDQAGKVIIIKNGVQMSEPLIDLSSRLVSLRNYDERGFLGLAVHPNFETNPKIYTYTSEPVSTVPATLPSPPVNTVYDHQAVVAEWTIDPANPDKVDMASRRELIRINEPQFNHNGGAMHFGSDGYLYMGFGDGGQADDQGSGHLADGNALDLSNPLGKILRIDVDSAPFANGRYGIPPDNPFIADPGLDEIWAYGLRNPYSFSFDSVTGNLYMGEVGQNKVEEVIVVTRGANCGWRLKEGGFFLDPNGTANGFISTIPVKPLPQDLLEPIAQYDHDDGISIIGGYVYHGSAIPGLQGRYVFGDFGLSFQSPSGKIFYLDTGNVIKQVTLGPRDLPLDHWIKGFGQDSHGEIYVCASKTLGPRGTTGVVFKLVAPASAQTWQSFQ